MEMYIARHGIEACWMYQVCTRLGQTENALQMYQRMREASPNSKMAPTVHAYTAAMRAATEGSKWKKALEIWQDMREASVDPSGTVLLFTPPNKALYLAEVDKQCLNNTYETV